MFNTKDLKTKEAVQLYVKPGNQKVIVNSIRGEQPADTNRSPFIELEIYPSGSSPENCFRGRLYTSDKALELTLERLKHICTKLITDEEFDAIGNSSTNVEEYAAKLNAVCAGKELRMHFDCEQYRNSNMEVKEKPMIPMNTPFAEATQPGSQYEPVSDNNSKLKTKIYVKEIKEDNGGGKPF